VGFTRRALALYLGLQGAAITLLGFVFGVLEAWGVTNFSHLNNAWITIKPTLDARILGLALLYTLGVLVTSTILPVGWLARLNLVELMRAE
jgi:ABC-type antimicrobial peptide transport system permease subunit